MNGWNAERRLARIAKVAGVEVNRRMTPEEKLRQATVLTGVDRAKSQVFHRALAAGCLKQGWPLEHRMTLWTLGVYANVFPVRHLYGDARSVMGPIQFAGPDFALAHSELNLFWSDQVLVALALKRRDAPGTDKRPYRQAGAGPYDRA